MIVLVTGSSRGIGKSLALAFGRAGHTVAVHAKSRRAEAEAVKKELDNLGVPSDVFLADISQPSSAAGLIDAVATKWGGLDVLVNNAGVTRDKMIFNMSVDQWRDVVDVNLSGSFWCLQAAAKVMRPVQKGSIINIASIVGVRGGIGCANYAASKAGVIGLTQAAARELGRFQIRVNAVLPGFHLTEMSSSIPEKNLEKVRAEHVLGQTTHMEDLCRMVLFLAETSSVSGQVFNVDSRIP